MNCRRFKRLLPGYLYGELAPGERLRFNRHSDTCPDCRRIREEMEETVSRLAAVRGPIFSRREKERLRERVQEAVRSGVPAPEILPRRFALRILPRPFLLPAALAAAVILLVLFREPDSPASESPEAAALAAFSEEVEEESRLLADVWVEIEEIEAIFSQDPVTGSGGEESGGDRSGRA